ncbi:MAG: methyltransferase domain-containing protein, partial [Polyangiaceae bacterium]
RAELTTLQSAVKLAAQRDHAKLRSEIASCTFRGAALRSHFDTVPLLERDHYVEEALGIAYPPLDLAALGPELTPYQPSSYDEIVHALDATKLAANDRFLDIGSGMGKAVLLAGLLSGATSAGIDCDESLCNLAANAAHELKLDGASFVHGDARDVALEPADVVFMYLPFTGSALARVMERLLTLRDRTPPRFICSGTLDRQRYPDLQPIGSSKSWLQIYASGPPAVTLR